MLSEPLQRGMDTMRRVSAEDFPRLLDAMHATQRAMFRLSALLNEIDGSVREDEDDD